MATIKKINEEQLCEDYLNESIGTDKLAERYHIGKKRVREILDAHGVERKKRGGQNLNVEYKVSDWKIVKYPEVEGKHYECVDRILNFRTTDIYNKGGVLTTHIEKEYKIKTPTLYDRRQYYMKTGNYWWEQWFDVELVDNKEVKKCPYCEWTTVDIENKSGMFETHLNKAHNKTKLEYLDEHPEDFDYFATVNRVVNRQMEKDANNFVTCRICGKKLGRIDTYHLKSHGMTMTEYKLLYGLSRTTCNSLHNRLSEAAIQTNSNMEYTYSSKDELDILSYIKSFGIECYHDRKILNGKEIDIYVPSRRTGIEYNGIKWHTEDFGKKDERYHVNKLDECNRKGIKLISIFEDEYILHKDIVLSKLCHILNIGHKNKRKIYARKCYVLPIKSNAAREFLNKNHIQGFVSSSVYLGGYYNDELIAVMAFKCKSGNWELTRFASDINSICCGIGGKLFNYFVKNYRFNEIKSFADRRWTTDYKDNIYTKLGFEFECFTPPSYTYYNEKVDRFRRFHKFGFRKEALLRKRPDFDPNMTEKEMTQKLGYDRIWDCGLIKYVYKKKEK